MDIGYTHTQDEVPKRQFKHLETAMDIIDENRNRPAASRFRWNPEATWASRSTLFLNIFRKYSECITRRMRVITCLLPAKTPLSFQVADGNPQFDPLDIRLLHILMYHSRVA